MTPHAAKKLIAAYLRNHGLHFTRLTARTVDFTDLARAVVVFVTVHGWPMDPNLPVSAVKDFAVAHGFRVEFDYHY